MVQQHFMLCIWFNRSSHIVIGFLETQLHTFIWLTHNIFGPNYSAIAAPLFWFTAFYLRFTHLCSQHLYLDLQHHTVQELFVNCIHSLGSSLPVIICYSTTQFIINWFRSIYSITQPLFVHTQY